MDATIKKELLALARKYCVKSRFVYCGDFGGKYDCNKKVIIINSLAACTRKEALSIFFHELGHWYCCCNNLWKNYHYPSRGINYDKILRIALKAERFVDRWAKNEMAKYCNLQFDGMYINQDSFCRDYSANYLRKYLIKYFKQRKIS
jgi:hypothetical protein